MKNLYYVFLLIFFFNKGYSQNDLQNANWTVRANRRIDFFPTSNPLNTFSSNISGGFGSTFNSASVSDRNGNFLFYTDGVTVWDSNDDVMDNGTDLLGQESPLSQNVLIIPNPNDLNMYYIITISPFLLNGTENGLRFSLVDMSLNNGLGRVLDKNVPLRDNNNNAIDENNMVNFGKITSARHSNGRDYWLIAEVRRNIFTYLIDNQGISLQVVTPSPLPDNLFLEDEFSSYQGPIKMSPNNERIIIGYSLAAGMPNQGVLYYGAFDNSNGTFTNFHLMQFHNSRGTETILYGAEFSPSGNIIHRHMEGFQNSVLISSEVIDVINGRELIVQEQDHVTNSSPSAANFQRAIDGRIYCHTNTIPNISFLSVIEFPNDLVNSNIMINSVDIGNLNPNMPTGALPPWVESQPCIYTLTSSIDPIEDEVHQEREDWIVSTDVITFNNNTIGSGVVYHAGNFVELNVGFEGVFGSKFSGYIEGCSNNFQYRQASSSSSTNFSIKKKSNLLLYPNPTNDKVEIKLNNQMFEKVSIATIDGKMMFESDIEKTDKFILDVSRFAQGIYIINVVLENGEIQSQKLIKK